MRAIHILAIATAFFALGAVPAQAQQAGSEPPPQQTQPQGQVQGQVIVQQQPVQYQPVQYQPVQYQPVQVPQQGQPMQPLQTETRSRPQIGLLASGIALLAGFYLANGFASMFAGYNSSSCGFFEICSGYSPAWKQVREFGLIPLIGPWIQIAAKPNSFGDDFWGTWLTLAGLGQTAGLVMLLVGALVRVEEQVPVRGQPTPMPVSLELLPDVGPSHAGLVLQARL